MIASRPCVAGVRCMTCLLSDPWIRWSDRAQLPLGRRAGCRPREPDGETASGSRIGLHLDPAAVHFNDPPADREPGSEAGGIELHRAGGMAQDAPPLEKGLEDAL